MCCSRPKQPTDSRAGGGAGFPKCGQLTGAAFERVFYKNLLAMGTKNLLVYMTYGVWHCNILDCECQLIYVVIGGTNFGGISHANGYTS